MSARGVLRLIQGGELAWWCPGCRCAHAVPIDAPERPGWVFNGDYDRPTFTPSAQSAYPIFGHVVAETTEGKCHCFVTDGEIRFLNDCTHAFAGKTVRLESF